MCSCFLLIFFSTSIQCGRKKNIFIYSKFHYLYSIFNIDPIGYVRFKWNNTSLRWAVSMWQVSIEMKKTWNEMWTKHKKEHSTSRFFVHFVFIPFRFVCQRLPKACSMDPLPVFCSYFIRKFHIRFGTMKPMDQPDSGIYSIGNATKQTKSDYKELNEIKTSSCVHCTSILDVCSGDDHELYILQSFTIYSLTLSLCVCVYLAFDWFNYDRFPGNYMDDMTIHVLDSAWSGHMFTLCTMYILNETFEQENFCYIHLFPFHSIPFNWVWDK